MRLAQKLDDFDVERVFVTHFGLAVVGTETEDFEALLQKVKRLSTFGDPSLAIREGGGAVADFGPERAAISRQCS